MIGVSPSQASRAYARLLALITLSNALPFLAAAPAARRAARLRLRAIKRGCGPPASTRRRASRPGLSRAAKTVSI